MRAKQKLIASVLFVVLGAWIAPAVTNPSLASDAVAESAVIVQGSSPAAVRAAVAAHHGTVTQDLWIVNGVAADVPAAELAALRAEPGVTHVSENAPSRSRGTPSPLHAPSAVYPRWPGPSGFGPKGVEGEGVTVAVVDTGISRSTISPAGSSAASTSRAETTRTTTSSVTARSWPGSSPATVPLPAAPTRVWRPRPSWSRSRSPAEERRQRHHQPPGWDPVGRLVPPAVRHPGSEPLGRRHRRHPAVHPQPAQRRGRAGLGRRSRRHGLRLQQRQRTRHDQQAGRRPARHHRRRPRRPGYCGAGRRPHGRLLRARDRPRPTG